MVGRGAADGGDYGVVMRVWMVWVVYSCVVAVVLRWSSSNADIRFTDIPGTGGLKLANVVLLRGPAGPIVVIVAFITAYHWGLSRRLGKSDLPLVAHLRGLGVAKDFGAFQGAVASESCGGWAGDVIHLLVGRRGDVNGKFRAA